MRTLLKISCRTEARSSRLSIAKVITCCRARRADSIRITIFSSISNLLSRKTLHNQSSNGTILQRNFPILRSWKLCLQPCWILAGNHAMHYELNTTFAVHKVLIALWESTLLTVFELVVDNIPLVVWCENWLRWAWWQLELDLEGPSSGIWREYGVDVEWFSKTEKNFSFKERKAQILSLTQYSLGVELKFVECVNFCCWAWLKYAVTLKENPLNVTWFWWAWLKSLLT